ncbi:maltokinase N-terminal cap-like domain-containing protein [Bailinhaonella thermotolerans]|uniref:1,4-alpha-glucan branching protein n=1 Tax=Bailinhaonella thermotolerans TaxID=1070861 RepID=A0A3A4A881_9ACTN|nr:1,4-alpha-glucan branching protein [Bailinhaonella thermotolerans]RJL22103.1 1,4-alpha-glucan branching protein [Bailinhaonella thermotolerans]
MAYIHRTTMTPGKLELLTDWLPKQPWYEGAGTPDLVKGGGFRLDDPEGEVGIEFMVVVDVSSQPAVAYHAPMTYRGAPLEDAPADALIGTAEHGVLGTRWIYDAPHDPVMRAQLQALLRGEVIAQHQNENDTPDPTVTVHPLAAEGDLDVRLTRVLRPSAPAEQPPGTVMAGWTWPDGTSARTVFATVPRP